MALIFPFSTCAICGEPLNRPYTATSGMPIVASVRFGGYYDAPLHFDCLSVWPHREEFSGEYFVSALAGSWCGYGGGPLLAATPRWLLRCGPAPSGEEPYFAEVRLAAWPFRLYSRWNEWDDYVAGAFGQKLAGPPLDAANDVMAEVRGVAPWLDALRALRAEHVVAGRPLRSLVAFGDYLATLWGESAYAWDWGLLEEERRAMIRENADGVRRRARAIARSNEAVRRLVAEYAGGRQLRCPHCRRRTRDVRFIDRGPSEMSYFICRACGRSFSGSEAGEEGAP